ncbi:MAG: phosphoesterase [Actinobacteria bacterium]|nr:MAG: phosphoesterase [Actinomycetota bacterium]
MKNVARGALLAAALLLIVVSAAGAKPKPKPKPPAAHLFVIMLENHSKSSVLGDQNAPYINSLAQSYAVAENYYGVTHPSEPNYVAAISGSNWFVNDDNPANRFNHTNVVDQLEAKKLSWGAYMESMPSVGYTGDFWPGTSQQLYASKHNPFVLFADINSNSTRMARIKPYTSLATDLQKVSTTPNFVWITPNQCHDMHGGVSTAVASDGSDGTPCPFGSTKDDANDAALKQKADAFVKGAVTAIMASPAWKAGLAAIFIVTDENDFTNNAATDGWETADGCCDSPILPPGYQFLNSSGAPDGHVWAGGTYGGGLIPAVIVTNKGKTGGYQSQVPYNHYSLLATVEAEFGLGYLANASDRQQVQPMTEFLTK